MLRHTAAFGFTCLSEIPPRVKIDLEQSIATDAKKDVASLLTAASGSFKRRSERSGTCGKWKWTSKVRPPMPGDMPGQQFHYDLCLSRVR